MYQHFGLVKNIKGYMSINSLCYQYALFLHLKQTCFPSTQDCLVQSLVETGPIVPGEKVFQCCQFIFTFFYHLSLETRGPRALIITWLYCKIIKYCKKFKHQEFNYYMTNLNIIIKWDPVLLTCTDYNLIPIFIRP